MKAHTLFLVASALSCALATVAHATPAYNNDVGTYTDPITTSNGFFPLQSSPVAGDPTFGVQFQPGSGGYFTLGAANTTGHATTVDITPGAKSAWGKAFVNFTGPASTIAITFIETEPGSDVYSLGSPIASSDPAWNGMVSLAGIPNTVTKGRIRFDLAQTTIGAGGTVVKPVILDHQVTWVPQSEIRVGLSAPATVAAGAGYSYSVQVAVSNVTSDNLVVYVPRPSAAADPFGQANTLSFLSATNGGLFTTVPVTIDGRNVPANSIYWQLGDVIKGTTLRLNFTMRAPNGTLAGTRYGSLAAPANPPTVSAFALNAPDAAATGNFTTVTSIVNLSTYKTSSNTYNINNQYHAQPETAVTWNVRVANWEAPASTGAQYYPDAIVKDCPNAAFLSALVGAPDFTVSNGGAFDGTCITWNIGTLTVGQQKNLTYTATLKSAAALTGLGVTQLDNSVTLSSGAAATLPAVPGANLTKTASHRIFIGIPETPGAVFAKGVRIRGSGSVSSNDDLPFTYVTYGEQLTWLLYAANTGASSLRNTVMVERITDFTTFQSAFLPAGVGTVYYNTAPSGTDDSPLAPPDINATTGVVGGTWSPTPPSDLTTVKWVMFRITELASSYFPESPPTASSMTGEVTVTVDAPPPGTCPTPRLKNTASFNYYGYEPPLTETLTTVTPAGWSTNMEPVDVKADVPSFYFSNASANPTALSNNGTVTFTIHVTNQQQGIATTDNALNTLVHVNVPAMDVAGGSSYLPLAGQVQAPGGVYQPGNDASYFTVDFGTIPGGESRTIAASFNTLPGFLSPETFALSATITADDNVCGPISKAVSAGATITASPWLVVSKESNFSTVAPDETFIFTLNYTNVGPAASEESWVIDRIPEGTYFEYADGPLPGGEVRFAAANGDNGCSTLPSSLSDPTFVWSQAVIDACFTPGVPEGGNQFSPSTGNARWVAFRVDHGTLTPKQLPVGGLGSVSFEVYVDEFVPVETTTLRNNAAIFGAGLLAAVSNDTLVLVANRPSVALDLTCPGVLSAGESVDILLSYYNDSTTSADTASVSIDVPAGYTYVSNAHVWNADSAGFVGTPAVVVTNGGQTLTWDITAATGGPLGSLQGGTFTVTLQASASLATGTLSQLTAISSSTLNGTPTVLQSAASCAMLIQNPDLCITKDVNQPAPLPGEQVTWFLTVSNVGLNDASAVTLTDTLPAGLTYVPDSTSIVSPIGTWTFVGSSNPAIAGSVLTWANLKHTGDPAGYFGPSSGNGAGPVTIAFKTTVSATTAPGTTLTNNVAVSTTTAEDDVCANTATAKLKTPLPDPWIAKTGPTTANPGDLVTWAVRFGNKSRAPAGQVLFIDDVPDLDGDGQADITYTGPASIPSGATIYFNGAANNVAAPAFNPSTPTANGWTTNASSLTRVNWIAVFVPSLGGNAGPLTAYINFLLTDPVSGLPVPDASSIDNCVAISMPSGNQDADTTNNNACATTLKTPGLDVAAGAVCLPGGSIPGATIGDEVSVVLSASNPATRPVYGVKLTWIPPAGFDVLGDDSASVSITDISGSAAALVDEFGNTFPGTVAWTKVGNTYYLGSTGNSGDADYYRRVGLPADSIVRITVAGVVAGGQSNNTIITHAVTVATDNRYDQDPGDPPEDVYTNNDSGCNLTVYLPDPFVEKAGVGISSDGPFTTGDQVTYTLSYNNAGGTDADDVTLVDYFPSGLGFVVGSLSNIPDGATVSYICCDNETPCVPAGIVDFNICGVEFHWDNMPAPANATTIYNTTAQFNTGTFADTIAANGAVYIDPETDATTGTWTSDLIPTAAGGNVVSWIRLAVESTVRQDDATLTFDILHGVTGAVIATGLTPDVSGGINLATIGALDGVPTIRVRANFGGQFFGCDYTYDHATPIPGVVTGTEDYYIYGCAGTDNIIFGEFESYNTETDDSVYYPAVWESTTGTYVATILDIGDSLNGGGPEGALSADIIIGYLESQVGSTYVDSVVAWVRDNTGAWQLTPIAGDLSDDTYDVWTQRIDPDLGRVFMYQQNNFTDEVNLIVATWDAPTSQFVVETVTFPFTAHDLDFQDGDFESGPALLVMVDDGANEHLFEITGPAGALTSTELPDPGVTFYDTFYPSTSGTAVVSVVDTYPNDGQMVLWTKVPVLGWVAENLDFALPNVRNVDVSFVSDDGNRLAIRTYADSQPFDFFRYYERDPGGPWTRIDILNLPAGYASEQGWWHFNDSGYVWGQLDAFPYTGNRIRFIGKRDTATGDWNTVTDVISNNDPGDQYHDRQPMLDQGFLWTYAGYYGAPVTVYKLPDTFPLGSFETIAMNPPTGVNGYYTYPDLYSSNKASRVDGCSLLFGNANGEGPEYNFYWDTAEMLSVPAEVDGALVPGTPDGRFADRRYQLDSVQGQIGDYFYGASQTGNYDVAFVATVTPTGVKSWAINGDGLGGQIQTTRIAEIARDGSWVIGTAGDSDYNSYAAIWTYNTTTDAYDGPVALPQDGGSLYAFDIQRRDNTTLWRLEGVVEGTDGFGTEGGWVPSTNDVSGWTWFSGLPAMASIDPTIITLASTAVDGNGKLRILVFSTNDGEEIQSYALVADAIAPGGYRLEALTVAGYSEVLAADIGAADVISATGTNGEGDNPIVFVPSGTGGWTGQAVEVTVPNGGEPIRVSAHATITARRTFADTNFPLLGGRLGRPTGTDQFVLQPDASGVYTQSTFSVGDGYAFKPFNSIVGLPIDAALVNYNSYASPFVPAGQPGFENGFVLGAYFETIDSFEPVAAMQVFNTTSDAWELVVLPSEVSGTYIQSVGLAEDNVKPAIFGYEGYCAPKTPCDTTPAPIGWVFPDEPLTAVRVDLTPPGFVKTRYVEPRWTSASNFAVTRAGSVTMGGGGIEFDDGSGEPRIVGKYIMYVAANSTIMAIPTDYIDTTSYLFDYNEAWSGVYRYSSDYIGGEFQGSCQGEGCDRKSMIWGCSAQAGVTLDRLEAVFRTDADPSVSYDLEVPDVCATSFTNNASISMVGSEITSENNDASVTLPIATSNIAVTMTADPGVAQDGETISYSAVVSNAGPNVATDVVLTVTIPNGDATAFATYNLNVGDLAVGATETFDGNWTTIVATPDSGVNFIASAEVTTTSIECSPDDNTATTSTLTGELPNVYVRKAAPATAALGSPFDYTITFGNNGNAEATNFTLHDVIPTGLTILAGDVLPVAPVQGDGTPTCTLVGSVVSCVPGPLAVGEWVITIPVVANDCAALNARYVNSVAVSADDDVNNADNQAQVSTTITATPGQMNLMTVASHGNVESGDQVTFFVYYQNNGAGPITADTTLTATIPAGSTFLFSDTGTAAGGVVTWPLDNDLLPGQSGAVAFTVIAGAAAPATLTSTATFDAVSPMESGACDVMANATTNVVAPGVHIVKQANQSVTCGGTVEWVLTVTNTGATDQTNLTITDTIASGFNLLSTHPAATVGGSTLSWNIPLLEAGGAISVYFTTTAPSGPGTYVTNRAAISGGGRTLATTAPVVVQNNCNAAMTVKKAWDNLCAQPGDTVNVTVTWKNTGVIALTGATITDFIQAGFDVGTIVPSANATWNPGSQTLTAVPGSILPGVGGSFTYSAVLTAADGDTFHNVATMTATDVEPAVSNQVNGVVLDCDDGDTCTTDYCEPLTGCVNTLQPNSSPEICDGIDNDCDGLVDTDDGQGDGPIPADGGLELDPCDNQFGVCQDSVTTPELCVGGVWLPCTVELYEDYSGGTYNTIDDTCDGIDEDCSGVADEEYDGGTSICGVGACAATGTVACINGVETDDCTPLAPTGGDDLICNGLDDDCDGEVIDEETEYIPETVSCGDNACATGEGMTYCENGTVQNTCSEVWSNISTLGDDFCLDSQPTPSNLMVIYLVVQGPDGQDAGSVRCWQNVDNGEVACDTEAVGSSVLKVYPELLCVAPVGAQP